MNLERSYITAARNGWDYSCCVKLNRAAAAATLQYVNVDIADPRHEEGLCITTHVHPSTPLPTALSPPSLSATPPSSERVALRSQTRATRGNRGTVTRNYFRRRIGGCIFLSSPLNSLGEAS